MAAVVYALGAVLVLWVLAVLLLAVSGRRVAAKELSLLLPNLLLLFRGLLRDQRVPRRTKVLVVLGITWLASPIDLIPEFIPVVGPLDDAIVAALVLRHVVRTAGHNVVREHWRGGESTLGLLLQWAGTARPRQAAR